MEYCCSLNASAGLRKQGFLSFIQHLLPLPPFFSCAAGQGRLKALLPSSPSWVLKVSWCSQKIFQSVLFCCVSAVSRCVYWTLK